MVLLLAWETWCPTWGFLPVTWQTRAMRCSAGKGRIIGRNRARGQAQRRGEGSAEARLGDPRGVVMGENDCRRVMPQGALHHFARVDTRLRQGAAEKLLVRDDAMLRVEEQHHEGFLFAPSEREAQVIAHRSRRRQRISRGDFLPERTARQLEGCLELRELGSPQTRRLREVRGSCVEQATDGAEAPQELACEVDRTLSLDAGTKQDCEQLRVRERGGAESEQAFAWTFLNGPVCYRHGIRLKSRFAA